MTGERIRALRKQAGWKQAELAKRLGLSTSAIGMYENNRREPPHSVLLQLSDIFGVTTDYLLCKPEECQQKDLAEELDALYQRLRKEDLLLFRGHPVSEAELKQVFRAARLGAELFWEEERMKKSS